MADLIGLSTEILVGETRVLIFQDMLLAAEGRMRVVEHGHAVSHTTNDIYEEWPCHWKDPVELLRHWRTGHGTLPRDQCLYLFDTETTEAHYLAYLTALALEDSA